MAVADLQRAGRGRLDREWEAPAGTSLLVSVLLHPDLPVGRLHLAVACMALAAADACAEVAGVRPGLKWPNDLVVGAGDRKLGGLLAEVSLPAVVVRQGDAALGGILTKSAPPPVVLGPGAGDSDSIQAHADLPAVVVGLGLNVDWPAGTVPQGAAALGPVDRNTLLEALLAYLGRRYGDWAGVADDYRSGCVTIGRQVRVQLAGETLTGTAVDISDDGHLVIAPPAGPRRTVTAGDLVHLWPDVPD